MCPFLNENKCEIATEIAGVPCPTTPKICEQCLSCTRPSRLNMYTMSLALVKNAYLDEAKLQEVIDGTSNGFGTRLHNTLGLILADLPDCKCPGHRDILDVWTPGYIHENMDSIINWLQTEAVKRGVPFFRPFVRLLLKTLLSTVPS